MAYIEKGLFNMVATDPEIDIMDFMAALKVVIDGGRVTRLEWDNQGTYMFLWGGFLSIHQDGKTSRLLVSDGDLLGTDWVKVSGITVMVN